ncbi:MAG: molybdopterin-dependent oxidoreductase, partial [Candidatus Dormibacteraceae bacterium]
ADGMATRRDAPTRLGARTNLGLIVLIAATFFTGWLAFAFATAPARWSLVIHATAGFAILFLLPWKSMVARHGMRRPRAGRWASILLAVLVLASLAAGLAHSTGILLSLGPFTPLELHVAAALVALPLVIWHVVVRPIRLRPADFSRRAFLRGGLTVALAAGTYAASEGIVRAAALPGAARRFTGSYEAGSYQPQLMPTSSWLFDPVPQIDAGSWSLRTAARTWSYDQLLAFDDRLTATLDCTGGFYSTQEWAGVRLSRLIGLTKGQSVRVVSSTGYDRRFPLDEAGSLVLATRFGGQRLDPGHGYPLRLVVPNRRGFWWVKWVVAVEIDDLPDWWQSPFPLQ